MSTTAPPAPPASPTKPTAESPWPRRLAIGLPVIVLLLIVVVANQTGTVLIARDLRNDYQSLVDEGREVLDQVAAAPVAAGDAEPAPVAPAPPAERPQVDVALELTEFEVTADVTEVPAFAEVTFTVTNHGTIAHDARVAGGASESPDAGTPLIEPGATETFTALADGSGELRIICTVAGHEAAGMWTVLPIVGEDGTATTAEEGAAAGGHDMAAHDPAAEAASPDNAADYTGERPPLEYRDPTAPPPATATVHDIELVVEERIMQIAEDVWQEVWTFGGTVPGPTLRVNIGDVVNIHLVNPADSGVDHSIDFHASQVAWNDEMTSIGPGEDKMYSFTATHAGIWMYHCGTAPTLHHIGNGMFGAIIVDPAEPLPPVDHEYVLVQSEYYPGPQGEVGDLTRMMEAAAAPEYVVFNGVANQYVGTPIEVGVGERVRTWILNAGPSVDSSFHIVGTIFDAVMKEGVFLDASSEWGSQALDLSPAQGGYVEFELAEDGLYPAVTHAFNLTGRGAMGLFQAGDGGAPPESTAH